MSWIAPIIEGIARVLRVLFGWSSPRETDVSDHPSCIAADPDDLLLDDFGLQEKEVEK